MDQAKTFDELDLRVGDIVRSPCWSDGEEREDNPTYIVESVKRRTLRHLGGLGLTYTAPAKGEGTGIPALYTKEDTDV